MRWDMDLTDTESGRQRRPCGCSAKPVTIPLSGSLLARKGGRAESEAHALFDESDFFVEDFLPSDFFPPDFFSSDLLPPDFVPLEDPPDFCFDPPRLRSSEDFSASITVSYTHLTLPTILLV